MQNPRLVSSRYVCMQAVLIPNEYVFYNTEFLCMQNKTYYSKMKYFVRNIEYIVWLQCKTISDTTLRATEVVRAYP